MNEGMENLKQIEELEERSMSPLMRIANAMEEILRLVKKDMKGERFLKNNKGFKLQAPSSKLQAASASKQTQLKSRIKI